LPLIAITLPFFASLTDWCRCY